MTRWHLLSLNDLNREALTELLDVADQFVEIHHRAIPKVAALRGKTVASLFFEDSTRTRLSFETAAKRLSADTMTFSAASSSVKKGESIRDTVETLSAYGVDAFVVRHRSPGVPAQMTRWTDAAIINAGDGRHQHPTQGLLDCLTIRQRKGEFAGLKIGIIGDVVHSRVARSDLAAFAELGAEVVLIGPRTLLPSDCSVWPVTVTEHLDEVLGELDVVYTLRMQKERMVEHLVPSLDEFTERFGITRERLGSIKSDALIMHPGPMNRGVEISQEAADDPRSVIIDQVANGVAVRMAVLFRAVASGSQLDAVEAQR